MLKSNFEIYDLLDSGGKRGRALGSIVSSFEKLRNQQKITRSLMLLKSQKQNTAFDQLCKLLSKESSPNRSSLLQVYLNASRLQSGALDAMAVPTPGHLLHDLYNRPGFVFPQGLHFSGLLSGRLLKHAYLQNFSHYSKAQLGRTAFACHPLDGEVDKLSDVTLDFRSTDWLLHGLQKALQNRSPRAVLNELFNKAGQTTSVLGLRVTLSGRLGRSKKGMAQMMTRSMGQVPLSSFHQKVDYSQGCVQTKLGTIGLKIWALYA